MITGAKPSIIVLDTETTGLTDPIGVVELAFIEVSESLEVLQEHCTLVNPGIPVEKGAYEIHGIADADLEGKPGLQTALGVLLNEDLLVIGHNCDFDLRVIGDRLRVCGTLCTLALSRRFVTGVTNHKLGTLKQELSLPQAGDKDHNALSDARTSLSLLRYVLDRYGLSLSTLFRWQEKPRVVHHMPWGSFEGRPLLAVPRSYRSWLLTQKLDKDLEYSLKQLENL